MDTHEMPPCSFGGGDDNVLQPHHQTAQVNSTQADKDGNVWVVIDGGMPQMVNWDEFLKAFYTIVKDYK